FQPEDGIRYLHVTGVQTCALPIYTGGAAADLVGHLNLIHPGRIQVFGAEEMSYYLRLDPRRRQHHLDELVAGGVPAIFLAADTRSAERRVGKEWRWRR